MQVNRILNINFKQDTNNTPKEAGAQDAILMLRDPNASVKFQQNQEFAENADSVTSNPLKALGYKLYRTFSMLTDEPVPVQPKEKRLNTLA